MKNLKQNAIRKCTFHINGSPIAWRHHNVHPPLGMLNSPDKKNPPVASVLQ